MIQWAYYPRSRRPPAIALKVIEAFERAEGEVSSGKHELPSDGVLLQIAPFLRECGFAVESGKKKAEKILVPVLFGLNGALEKSFEADAYHEEAGFVVEVEAGRGVVNNQFLKDLFQACMMHNVSGLAIAVRLLYRKSRDFERVLRFFDTLFASGRLQLPLEGVLIIGY